MLLPLRLLMRNAMFMIKIEHDMNDTIYHHDNILHDLCRDGRVGAM